MKKASRQTTGRIELLKGTVKKGKGNAAQNFSHIMQKIADRVGLATLQKGTLNIQLDGHYPITAVTAIITDKEYAHEQECIKLRRCRVGRADGGGTLKAVIVRPSQHEDPWGRSKHYQRFELMSPHHLMTELGLSVDDTVRVELERENKTDRSWWDDPGP